MKLKPPLITIDDDNTVVTEDSIITRVRVDSALSSTDSRTRGRSSSNAAQVEQKDKYVYYIEGL